MDYLSHIELISLITRIKVILCKKTWHLYILLITQRRSLIIILLPISIANLLLIVIIILVLFYYQRWLWSMWTHFIATTLEIAFIKSLLFLFNCFLMWTAINYCSRNLLRILLLLCCSPWHQIFISIDVLGCWGGLDIVLLGRSSHSWIQITLLLILINNWGSWIYFLNFKFHV